mgnify:FL=1
MASLTRATGSPTGDFGPRHEELAPSRECAETLRALRELYEPRADAPPIMALSLLHDLARRSSTMERVLATEALGRQRLAGELRRAMEDAIARLSFPDVRTDDNGHGTLVVHGLQRQARDEVPDSAESSSEGEWWGPTCSRVGDAYQVDVPPMGTESAERKDRLIWSEQQIWASEDRKPKSHRSCRKRFCSTPGCSLPDGHIGPHTGEAACEGTRSWESRKVKKFNIPVKKPTVYTHKVVGRRISVYWPSERKWFSGTVYAYDELTDFHSVLYDDGDDNVECLCDPTTTWKLED